MSNDKEIERIIRDDNNKGPNVFGIVLTCIIFIAIATIILCSK